MKFNFLRNTCHSLHPYDSVLLKYAGETTVAETEESGIFKTLYALKSKTRESRGKAKGRRFREVKTRCFRFQEFAKGELDGGEVDVLEKYKKQ